MQQSISITRALVELKRYDQRIAQALQAKFIERTIGQGDNRKVPFSTESVADVEKNIRASYDKVDALLANRAKVKSAIVLSNANTKVKVLDQEVTVAEAIEMKTSVQNRKHYVNTLRSQLQSFRQVVDSDNQKLQTKIDSSLDKIYGTEKAKIDAEMVKLVSEPQMKLHESKLLDPAGIEKRIEKLQAEITEIETELDFALSESNARTEISVDLS